MLSNYFDLTSPSFSYAFNYEKQSSCFSWLDEKTEKPAWVMLPATCALVVSNAVTLTTRIMGVAESFFYGSAVLLTAPFSERKTENAKLGLHEIFVHTSKNILRVVFLPVEICVEGIVILIEPKLYIILMSESMKINSEHARNMTLGTKEHYQDLREVEGISNEKLLEYQWNKKINRN
jgi:hypothetical protein